MINFRNSLKISFSQNPRYSHNKQKNLPRAESALPPWQIGLRQPRLTYSACGPFTKSKEKKQKVKEMGDSRNIFQNEPDKACFQLAMAYGDFKDLTRRTVSGKILHNKAFNIVQNPKKDGYQRGISSMVPSGSRI